MFKIKPGVNTRKFMKALLLLTQLYYDDKE